MESGAGRGLRGAVVAVLALGLGDRARQKDHDPVLGFDEDQGAADRITHSRGQSSSRETHLGGRGAGLEGNRVRRVLSGAEHDELCFVRLSCGVSGVGGVVWLCEVGTH